MNFRLLLRGMAIGLCGSVGLTLAGCGGGGSPVAPGVATRAALTGAVQAPQSQTRAASRDGVASDPLVAVPGATVTLVNLDDATTPNVVVAGTTVTGADGSYSFPTVIPGANYKIEATKSIGSKTLTLDAIVTAPDATAGTTVSPPVTHDLTPNTTVAAVAIIQQVAALKAADPTSKHTNLQALADDLTQKRQASNTPPPDCTNPTAVTNDANTLKQAATPKGSYTGLAITTGVAVANADQKVGDTTRLAAQIDSAGHFFLVALSHDNKTTSTTSTKTGSGTSGTGTSTGTSSDDGDFAVGIVTSDGIVNGATKNGKIKIVGIFTSGVGAGTYSATDGSEKGTWSLVLLKNPYSGLYAGKYASATLGSNPGGDGNGSGSGNGTGSGTGDGGNTGNGSGGSTSGGTGGLSVSISNVGGGDFALLVLDDNTAFVMGAGHDGGDSVYGTGTVSATGAVTFQVTTSSGTSVTGTGQINSTTHTVTGTFTTGSSETGQFAGRSDHADTSDL